MLLNKMLYVMLGVYLISCSGISSTTTQISQNYAPTSTEYPAPIPITVTPFVTVSTKPSEESHLILECIEILQFNSESPELENSILLLQETNSKQAYLWSLSTLEKYPIEKAENEILSDFKVSLNGEWLAMIRSTIDGIVTTNSSLEIRKSSGELHKVMPVDIAVFIARWLNNEQLLLDRGLAPQSKQWILDPFTGEQIDLDLVINDLYNLPVTNNRWGNALLYDPSLTRVVYAGEPADIVMIDIENNNTIVRVSPVSVQAAMPQWSPDGQQLAIVYVDILKPINVPGQWIHELYAISRDGQFTQLTNLSAYYNHPQIRKFSWSPNGEMIAFWLESDPQKSSGVYEFAVLDLKTNKVTNYCIKTVPQGQIPSLFWSPDSQKIAIDVYDDENKTKDILIIDIVKSTAAKIAENLDLLGWMTVP